MDCCRGMSGKGYKYKIRWKDLWLLRNILEDTERLLQGFETQDRTQQRLKKPRAAFVDESR